MNAFLLLANTAESKSHSFFDALPHMAGMAVVMITLAVLWGICAFTAKMVSIAFPEKAPAKPVAPPAVAAEPSAATRATTAAPAPADSGVSSEIVAVIAAAVATVTRNEPVRIVSIKPMSTSWERAGRQSVLTSHRIR